MSDYKFVTRKDLIAVWPIGEDLEAKDLVSRLFFERDAYREVAKRYVAHEPNIPKAEYGPTVDYEAARILKGK